MKTIDHDLLFACAHVDIEKIKLCLALGADPNVNFSGLGAFNLTPLGVAIGGISRFARPLHENPAILAAVKMLLAHGADPNLIANANQETPLHVACFLGDVQVAETLIRAGACMETLDTEGNNAIRFAMIYGASSIAALLLRAGFTPGKDDIEDLGILCVEHFKPELGAAMIDLENGLPAIRLAAQYSSRANPQAKAWLAAHDARKAAETVLSQDTRVA